MRDWMRAGWLLTLWSLAGTALWAQEPVATPPTAASAAPAATVNGQPIPEVAVQRALRAVPPEKQADARGEILNFLIDNVLIEQHLAPQVPVTPQEVQARLEELRDQLVKQKLEYARVLQDMMLSEDELAGHIRAEVRWEKYVDRHASDQVLQALFEQNKELFDGSLVRARHVLLAPPPGDAQAVQQARQELSAIKKDIEYQVAKGLGKLPLNVDNLTREKERAKLIEEAFADMARKKSACPSREQGGDVNYFPRFGGMVEPFAQAAFALKPYQMSDIVQTQFGLHLILVTDRKPGKADVKFDEVKDDVREVYAFRLREGLARELRQKAKISMK